MKKVSFLAFWLGGVLFGAAATFCQTPIEHLAPNGSPQPHPRIVGYLAGREPGFLTVLSPYPALDSMTDQSDTTTLWQSQHPDPSRWQLANADAEMSYSRFSQAFGIEINSATMPLLAHLLNRTEQDVQSVAFSAKDYYNRPRPYQRFQLAQVCGTDRPPAAEVPLKGGNSYPSGHTSFGWAVVLILAEVAPERAQTLLARGREYGESRVVCGVHYPSDIAGGELIATAVVGRLHGEPEFEKDLACAKEEHSVALHPGEKLSHACRQREAQPGQAQAPTIQSLPVSPWPGCPGDLSDPSKPCALAPQ
jgi:acid phosphatase (class A)